MHAFNVKSVYIDKLDDIVNKYNNTYHRTNKITPVDVRPSTYIDFGIKNNDRDPKFEDGEHVRISKYKKNRKSLRFRLVLRSFCNWTS